MSRSTVRLILACAAGCAAMYGVLAINVSWLTPGAHGDSVAYLSAAESLVERGVLEVPVAPWSSPDSVARLAHFPPGFPTLIALPMAGGVRSHPAALWVMAVSAGIALGFAFLLVSEAFGTWAGLLAAVLLWTTPVLTKLHLAIWSEPSYLAVTLGMLYLMWRRPRWVAAHGLLAGVGLAIRYVGIAGTLAAVAWAALNGRTRRERVVGPLVAGAPSALFLLWWRSYAGAGQIRSVGLYGDLARNARDLVGMLGEWLVPMSWPGGTWAALALVAVGGLLLVSGRAAWAGPERGRLARLLALYGGLYVAVVVGSRLLADPRIPFDARLFVPVLVLATLAFAASVQQGVQGHARSAVAVLLGAWCFAGWAEIQTGVRVVNDVGRYYTWSGWISDPVIRWLDNRSRGIVLYSNEPELVYYQTRRHARQLPDAGEDLAAFRAAFHARPSAVVIAYPLHPGNLSPATFAQALTLAPVVQTSLGSVWASAQEEVPGG